MKYSVLLFLFLSAKTFAGSLDYINSETLLINLPSQLGFQINFDIIINPGADTVVFQDGAQTQNVGNCVLTSCPAKGHNFYAMLAQTEDENPKTHGCEIRLRQKSAEPRIIKARQPLVTVRRTTDKITGFNGCNSRDPQGGRCIDESKDGDIFMSVLHLVQFDFDSESSLEYIKCGSSSKSDLTKGFLKRQFGAEKLELFGPELQEVK